MSKDEQPDDLDALLQTFGYKSLRDKKFRRQLWEEAVAEVKVLRKTEAQRIKEGKERNRLRRLRPRKARRAHLPEVEEPPETE